ncbi:MAG: hypothetical protein ABR524_14410 [Thermoanaerobaculia bacterium]
MASQYLVKAPSISAMTYEEPLPICARFSLRSGMYGSRWIPAGGS